MDGIRSWLPVWKRNGWRTAARKPVKNIDLWQRLDDGSRPAMTSNGIWVRGHAGHAENERVDALARREAKREGGEL